MQRNQSINDQIDPVVTGLQLLAHVVGDPDLGDRFLALTGMSADDLRARATDRGVLAALIDFLAARDDDLLAAADALALSPAAIIAVGKALDGDQGVFRAEDDWT